MTRSFPLVLQQVGQMVHAIKMGWMKPRQEKTPEEEEEEKRKRYDIWADDAEDNILKRYRQHIPAPKTPLPGHAESYNPPSEYLFTKEEVDCICVGGLGECHGCLWGVEICVCEVGEWMWAVNEYLGWLNW